MQAFYPIGTPGQPWTKSEQARWFAQQKVQRSYQDEVLSKLDGLRKGWEIQQYGALPIDEARYPLMALQCARAGSSCPWVVITGGVHGYETSGVQGALQVASSLLENYKDRLNFLVAPCVSPWGYEVIQRWNPDAVDPNRSFRPDSPAREAGALMALAQSIPGEVLMHMDLHETTDTDESEFRPALAAKQGEVFEAGTIPDGFYTVADSENLQLDFQKAIVDGVERVTHIAPPDENNQLIGSDMLARGIIAYPYHKAGLCGHLTKARFTTTTEVYPDSPKATPEICIQAQVAAVQAGLDFALAAGH